MLWPLNYKKVFCHLLKSIHASIFQVWQMDLIHFARSFPSSFWIYEYMYVDPCRIIHTFPTLTLITIRPLQPFHVRATYLNIQQAQGTLYWSNMVGWCALVCLMYHYTWYLMPPWNGNIHWPFTALTLKLIMKQHNTQWFNPGSPRWFLWCKALDGWGWGVGISPLISIIFISDRQIWYRCVSLNIIISNMSYKLILDS